MKQIKIPQNATYQQTADILCAELDVDAGDVSGLRVGLMKSPTVTSFKGLDFTQYMKSLGLFPSTTRLYIESEAKCPSFADESEDESQAPVGQNDPPPKEEKTTATRKRKADSAEKKGSADEKKDDRTSTAKKTTPMSVCLDMKDVTKLEEIGKGGMARVFKGKWRDTDVAIKQVEGCNSKVVKTLAELMEKEIQLHSSLTHVNILPMQGYCKKGSQLWLITPLMHSAMDKVLYPEEGECELTPEQQIFVIKEMLQ